MACTSLGAELLSRVSAEPRAGEPQGSWELLIAGYLYLGGLGAGAFTMTVVAGWLGFELAPTYVYPVDGWTWDWSKALVLWGPFLTAFGASLLVFHLGKNRLRAFTACFNPRTSWMARGFIILASFIVIGCLVGLIAIFAPLWEARLGMLWPALEALGLVLALGTAIYTGILLQSMTYIPAWNSPFLPFLFLASALSTGAMGVLMGAMIYRYTAADQSSAHRLAHALEVIEPALIALEASLLALYVSRLRKGKAEGLLSATMWLTGSWRLGFWGGVVGLALALPFLLDVINVGLRSDVLAMVASGSVLVGGFLLRCGVLAIGIKEAPPLYRLSKWRLAHPASEQTRPLIARGGR